VIRAPWLAGAAVLAALALLWWGGRLRPSPDAAAAADARAKLETLADILRTRNDNDPRLDREFLGLSPQAKALFRAKYRAFPRERVNERGTIVYLLGRNLTAPEDWAFFRDVAAEPPCLGLADCSKPSAAAGEAGDDVTLSYPSLVALRQAHRAAQEGAPKDEARSVLEAAKTSRARAVRRLASSLEPGFAKKSP
jgi:hypothetical protein